MTLDPEIGVFLLSLFIGFGVGLVSGTMGVGGGIIMVPAAVLILGYGQHIGQGISLVVMIPTTLAGAITHYRMKNLELRPVLLIAIGAVAAGSVGCFSCATALAGNAATRLQYLGALFRHPRLGCQ